MISKDSSKFKLVAAAAGGPIYTWLAASAAVLAATLLFASSHRAMSQICPSPAPVYLCGTNLVWNFTGGFAYTPFYVVVSTNTLLPSAFWTRVATNMFDASGRCTLILPIEPDKPCRFYRVALPVN